MTLKSPSKFSDHNPNDSTICSHHNQVVCVLNEWSRNEMGQIPDGTGYCGMEMNFWVIHMFSISTVAWFVGNFWNSWWQVTTVQEIHALSVAVCRIYGAVMLLNMWHEDRKGQTNMSIRVQFDKLMRTCVDRAYNGWIEDKNRQTDTFSAPLRSQWVDGWMVEWTDCQWELQSSLCSHGIKLTCFSTKETETIFFSCDQRRKKVLLQAAVKL